MTREGCVGTEANLKDSLEFIPDVQDTVGPHDMLCSPCFSRDQIGVHPARARSQPATTGNWLALDQRQVSFMCPGKTVLQEQGLHTPTCMSWDVFTPTGPCTPGAAPCLLVTGGCPQPAVSAGLHLFLAQASASLEAPLLPLNSGRTLQTYRDLPPEDMGQTPTGSSGREQKERPAPGGQRSRLDVTSDCFGCSLLCQPVADTGLLQFCFALFYVFKCHEIIQMLEDSHLILIFLPPFAPCCNTAAY